MSIINVEIDETTILKAEGILKSIGLDMQTAINIFLRRVIIEKGLPLQMTTSEPNNNRTSLKEEVNKNSITQTRRNNAITQEMIDEVWNGFLKYHKGLSEISQLRYEISENTGMNNGSVFIYLNILANLVKGESNKRTLKMSDLEYFMDRIREELSPSEYQNALKSLKDSIPYWREKLPGAFANHVERKLKSIW